jgi:glycerophosphoryl diester phosphodiesterase
MIIFGHRGAPGFPRVGENTVASFRKALQSGATGLEFDVRRCGDAHLVVIHDETIDRTTNGTGPVAALSYDQLRRFNAGFGEPVPLLTDVLDQFGSQCLLNIELKDVAIASKVRELVLERGNTHNVIVSSFNWNELSEFLPEISIALLGSTSRGLIAAAKKLGARAIHPRRDIVTPSLIAEAHAAGLAIHVWTVNDSEEMRSLQKLGVDGIFTDFPERWS